MGKPLPLGPTQTHKYINADAEENTPVDLQTRVRLGCCWEGEASALRLGPPQREARAAGEPILSKGTAFFTPVNATRTGRHSLRNTHEADSS